jgi:hypothetical protein
MKKIKNSVKLSVLMSIGSLFKHKVSPLLSVSKNSSETKRETWMKKITTLTKNKKKESESLCKIKISTHF